MKANTLPTILNRLSDWKTCNDTVTGRIKDLLPNNSCTTRIPRPTRVRYAQKIVNQSLSTLSKVYKEQIDNHNNGIDCEVIKTRVKCLVEVTLYCIQVLEGEAKTSCKPLDIEKAYSNIIVKMVDFKRVSKLRRSMIE